MRRIRELRTLFVREMRHLMRDQHTLIYSVAIPLFLYPAVLFVVFQALALIEGWKDKRVSVIELAAAEEQPLLERLFQEDARIRVARRLGPHELEAPDVLTDRLRRGELDALVRVDGNVSQGGPVGVDIHFSSVRDGSLAARSRVERILEAYRDKLLLLRALEAGKEEDYLAVLALDEQDVASGERKANFMLSLILPLLMVVIIVMGAFYPALDAGAGERERRTLETTLVSPVSRTTMVLAKYLAVTCVALIAFVLNFGSMAFSMKHLLVQLKVQAFTISAPGFLVVCGAAVLLAGLISALLIVVAFLARSFKEGQSYMTPVYLIVILPMMVTLSPDTRLTTELAAVPILNVILLFREALQSRFEALPTAVALGSSAVYVALALWASVSIVAREEFLLGARGVRRRPATVESPESSPT